MARKKRNNNQRKVIYWLRHHTEKLAKVLKRLEKK